MSRPKAAKTMIKHLNDQEVLERAGQLARLTREVETLEAQMKKDNEFRRNEIKAKKLEIKRLARIVESRDEEVEDERQTNLFNDESQIV